MQTVKLTETLFEMRDAEGAPRARIEYGPQLRTEIATKELLSNEVTAEHYQVNKPDKLGKPIKIGEPMNFLDWKNRATWVWHVYEYAQEDWAGPQASWRRRGFYADKIQAAIEAALIARGPK